MMYLTIIVKIVVGMLGVLFFLRISGKTQMAQLTPLDSVNAFVLGALVGGVSIVPMYRHGNSFSLWGCGPVSTWVFAICFVSKRYVAL